MVGPCRKVEVEEVDLRSVDDPKDPEAWEKEIGKSGIGGTYIFSDGSLLESGNVGGRAFIVGSRGAEVEVECGIGNIVTVSGLPLGLKVFGPWAHHTEEVGMRY